MKMNNAICNICGKPAGPLVADNPQVYHMECLLDLTARQRARLKQIEAGNGPNDTRMTQEERRDFPYDVLTGIRYRKALNERLTRNTYYGGEPKDE